MKKLEFKELIKESVREALLDEGLLKQVITEVMKSTAHVQTSVINTNVPMMKEQSSSRSEPDQETMQTLKEAQQKAEKYSKKMMDMRERLMGAIEKSSAKGMYNAHTEVDFFEGTTPLSSPGSPGQANVPSSPLGGVMPNDAGVDISALTEKMNVWKELIK
jgi:hypothetical protein